MYCRIILLRKCLRAGILLFIGDITTNHIQEGSIVSFVIHILLGIVGSGEIIRYEQHLMYPLKELGSELTAVVRQKRLLNAI